MLQHTLVADRILEAVQRTPDCTLEELVDHCPDLTWNQVFLEVDRMSREGQLKLTSRGAGSYTIRLHISRLLPRVTISPRQPHPIARAAPGMPRFPETSPMGKDH